MLTPRSCLRGPATALAACLWAALAPACGAGGDGPGGPMGLDPCAPPLSLSPEVAEVAPDGLLVLHASGGAGEYGFRLVEDRSGATVHPQTGIYLAGSRPATDVVAVTDDTCFGEATATITVTEMLSIAPARVELAPGASLAFVVEGGSGEHDFALARAESGGSIDAGGRYTAGAATGQDRVRVTDRRTRETADAVVEVTPLARLSPAVERVYIPVGSRYPVRVEGGSGVLEATVGGAAIAYEGGALVAEAAGRATVELRDRFTGQTATLEAVALDDTNAPTVWSGDRSEWNRVVGPGDLDGDGVDDFVVAYESANAGRYRSGVVQVWSGAAIADGPAMELRGTGPDEGFGFDVDVADLDGDGERDLIVGALDADITSTNTGAVFVYRGVAGRFFAEEPDQRYFGVNGFDRFGFSLATCDFNGDGDLDLAVGATDAEDRDLLPRLDQQGAVFVYISRGGRLPAVPTQVRYGAVPDGRGGFAGHPNLRLGRSMAAGDFDGDGLCDLAVGALQPTADVGNDGAVMLYRGVAPTPPGRGGIEELPARMWAATTGNRGSRFGEFVEMGDVDGDGLADVLASHFLWDVAEGNDAGAARLFRGRALAGPAAAIEQADSAEWSHVGTRGGDFTGMRVLLEDMDGDGLLDVVSSDPRSTVEGSELSRPGVIRIFAGRPGGLPSSTPTREIVGLTNDTRFGQGLGVVAREAGAADLLVLAPYADDHGYDVVSALLVAGATGEQTLLGPVGEPSGRRLGAGVAIVGDVTGDGHDDAVLGAPYAADPRLGHECGEAYLLPGLPGGGFAREPALTIAGFPGHGGGDHLGRDATRAGDFDGDGLRDFAVLSEFDGFPSDLAENEAFTVTGDCSREGSRWGAVNVFRGARGLPSTTPAFVYFGPYSGRGIEALAGGFDYDGDGLSDLLVGGRGWTPRDVRSGGFALLRGRAADPAGKIVVVCAPDFQLDGEESNDDLGYSVTALGDLDDDGCDDLAIGAPLEHARVGDNPSDEGVVYVLFGWNDRGCSATAPRPILFEGASRAGRAGFALAGGHDLDADGVEDLVVGEAFYRDDRGEIGRVHLVTGRYILDHRDATDRVPLIDGDEARRLTFDGESPGERLGWSVAIVPPAGGGAALVAAGAPWARATGAPDTGAVRLFELGPGGFDGRVRALVVGEATPGNQLGLAIAAGAVDGRPAMVVGAPWSSASGLEDGAGYTLDLGP